jgi:hypothetical protein
MALQQSRMLLPGVIVLLLQLQASGRAEGAAAE